MRATILRLSIAIAALVSLIFAFGCGSSPCSACSMTAPPPAPSVLYAIGLTSGLTTEVLTVPVDSATGALGTPTSMPSPAQPFSSIVTVGTQFLYIPQVIPTDLFAQIYGYSIDQNTGALTAIPSSPFQTPSATTLNGGTAIDNFFYVGSNSILGGGIAPAVNAFSIGSDGALTQTVAGSPFVAGPYTNVLSGSGPRVSAQSGYLYATEYEVSGSPGAVSGFSIDATTGVLTPIPGSPFPIGAQGTPGQIVYDSAVGPFVYVSVSDPTINGQKFIAGFAVDQTTGALTPVPGSPFTVTTIAGLVLDASGQFLFTGLNPDQSVTEFKVQANGSLASIAGSSFVDAFSPLLVHGNFLFASSIPSSIAVFTIDETSGAVTPVAGSPFQVGAAVYSMAAVTLPSQ